MKKILFSLAGVVLLLVGCTTLNNEAGKLNPTIVESQTIILVQGAEIALSGKPTVLAEFKTGAQVAGNYLIQISASTVVMPTDALQTVLQNLLLSKGISAANAAAIASITVAEYNLIAAQYGFSGGVPISISTNVPAVNALLAAIGKALLTA